MKLRKLFSFIIAAAMIFSIASISTSAAPITSKYTPVTETSVTAIPQASNGIINGSVENTNFFEGSVTPWNHAVTDNTVKIEGQRSIRIDPSQNDGGIGITFTTDIFDDEAYKLTMYVKATNVTEDSYFLQSYIYDIPGTSLPNTQLLFKPGTTSGLLEGKWVKGELYFTTANVPNGAHNIHIMRMPAPDQAVTATGVYYVDNMSLEIIDKADIPQTVTPTPPPVVVKAPKTPTIKYSTKITKKTTYIQGTTSAKAKIKIIANKKLVKSGTADSKGAFKLRVNLSKYKAGTKIYVYAYNLKGKTEVKSKQIYVKIR